MEEFMRRMVLVVVVVTVTAVAGVVAYMESASGQSNGDAAPIYGVKLPEGYRDWRLISVKRLTGKQLTGTGRELKQLRAELGNDLAIKAYRDGTLPFPDGATIAALHWNEDSSDSDNQALAAGFPGLGLESTFAGSAVNVQFMVKDSKKYAASGGLSALQIFKRAINFGEVEEPSSSRSRSLSAARRAATFAILMAIL
jgi:Cytochrome P460